MHWIPLLVLGCSPAYDPGPEPAVVTPEPALRRLTIRQYTNTLQDLYGEDLVLPTSLEPDTRLEGLASLGAAVSATSPLGVERYERAADLVASQLLGEGTTGGLPCDPSGPADSACARQFVEAEGMRVFRRSLTPEEIDRLAGLVTTVGSQAGDFRVGAFTALTAMLQSPHFVYRTEHAPGTLDAFELASRLSYFLWDGPPDTELLEAAASGALLEPDMKREQVERMVADARFRRGVRDFFGELYHLEGLDGMTKDPNVFSHASPELWASSKVETLAVIEDLVVDRDADYRTLMTSRRTYVDHRLAALYEIPAPTLDGFAWVELPESTGRRGLLGHASVLGLNAHPTRSSATRRGKFIRGTLLCQFIPPPPADVDTSIPEASNAPTLRDRLQVHQEDPTCASCHVPLDSVGLALENFDGEARWRERENDARIDPSGVVDGLPFDDAVGLGDALASHEDLTTCITEQLYAYAVGHPVSNGEDEVVLWLHDDFAGNGFSVAHLMEAIALSDVFAKGGTP
ncbi:MAG: DUF1592 domain-containing protein [Alphaproteobacteria bacterium]|nr:DUF1592 domain-containing protein [Alphaproteobacteria bacterium]MCB9693268.1 DUF1592 domain-containing protein [Alphaproteobacteria bacterium]